MNNIDLNNKVAIVTGGAQGFGFSMVERFSASGAKVIIMVLHSAPVQQHAAGAEQFLQIRIGHHHALSVRVRAGALDRRHVDGHVAAARVTGRGR